MKHNIAKSKMISEYVEAGKFDLVTFDKQTGKRLGTHAGLDAHKALSEALPLIRRGVKFLLLKFPEGMSYSERHEAERTFESAAQYAAEINLNR